jgi:predicted AlkP superfamily pyrophosphatase or phosphodiesterase
MHPDFVAPVYGPGGFSSLPGAIKDYFAGGKPWPGVDAGAERLVLGFIDAFGWRQFRKFSQHPFLRRFRREGSVGQWTSQFPSTTPAHVACIHSGLEVGRSGLLEWFYYNPGVDAMIAPLLYSFAGSREIDGLAAAGIDPGAVFPEASLYLELAAAGTPSIVFQPWDIYDSTATRMMTRGAESRGYSSLEELGSMLNEALAGPRGRGYFFFYYDGIDSVSHVYGPDSPQAEREILGVLDAMEAFLAGPRPSRGRTLLLLVADHGQVRVDPATTVYLNLAFPGIEGFLRRDARGRLLVPGGACRDMFLYVRDGAVDEL